MASPSTTIPRSNTYIDLIELDWSDRLFLIGVAVLLLTLPSVILGRRGVKIRLEDVTSRAED